MANLTGEEYRRFQAAHIPYSGATGMGRMCTAEEPYIATFMTEWTRALTALGWRHVDIEMRPTQWIVRRSGRAALVEERDWLYERCEWLEGQEARAWNEVRRLERQGNR